MRLAGGRRITLVVVRSRMHAGHAVVVTICSSILVLDAGAVEHLRRLIVAVLRRAS